MDAMAIFHQSRYATRPPSGLPTIRSESVNATASGGIYLRLLLRRDLVTAIGFTEPEVSILGLSRPRTAGSLGLRLW